MKRQHLEVGDLPKDGQSYLHKLRPTLVRVFNTARTSPARMALLKATMKFMYNKCVEYEKAHFAQPEPKPVAKKAKPTPKTEEGAE